MADIYLKQLKDRRNYAKCYVDLIEVYYFLIIGKSNF